MFVSSSETHLFYRLHGVAAEGVILRCTSSSYLLCDLDSLCTAPPSQAEFWDSSAITPEGSLLEVLTEQLSACSDIKFGRAIIVILVVTVSVSQGALAISFTDASLPAHLQCLADELGATPVNPLGFVVKTLFVVNALFNVVHEIP